MIRSLVAASVIFISALSSASAAPQIKVTGVFSDLHFVAQAGDVTGTEIFIVFGGEQGYFAIIQCAEGWPSKPVIVPAIVHGAEVEFAPHGQTESHCPNAKFRGTVSSSGLRGKFENTDYPGFLKRKRSYWQ
ncbi:hypothetical protein ACFONG_19360 [Uliginosibacterium paludis]|uniref:Uncharacterized protein n=1 Tax=Uliginosibacterium paludis TaxID=1615952 RepID=A0ABV2CVR6_9RHOO